MGGGGIYSASSLCNCGTLSQLVFQEKVSAQHGAPSFFSVIGYSFRQGRARGSLVRHFRLRTRAPAETLCTGENISSARKVDVRLPGKGNSNSHGARPVLLIITMIKWIRTSRLSIKNILSLFSVFGFFLRQGRASDFEIVHIKSGSAIPGWGTNSCSSRKSLLSMRQTLTPAFSLSLCKCA